MTKRCESFGILVEVVRAMGYVGSGLDWWMSPMVSFLTLRAGVGRVAHVARIPASTSPSMTSETTWVTLRQVTALDMTWVL